MTTLPPSMRRLSRQYRIFNISQPYRPPRPVTGIALLYGDGVCFLWGTNWLYVLLQVASISQLTVSRLSRQCGILNISQPYRPPRPVKGIALHFLLFELYTVQRRDVPMWTNVNICANACNYVTRHTISPVLRHFQVKVHNPHTFHLGAAIPFN
jgi:hypothetical protein